MKVAVILFALIATIVAPFLLRPAGSPLAGKVEGEVVIVTPHNETIRQEFERAFAAYTHKHYSKRIGVDWRTPGSGTSEITRVINSEFVASFENYWKRTQKEKWKSFYASVATDGRLEMPEDKSKWTSDQNIRELFLNSDVGIGIDLFFGGGAYDFGRLKDKGFLVASDPTGQFGIPAVARKNPAWFTEEVIPSAVSGEPFYDEEFAWIGTCLSSFGICYNSDILKDMKMKKPPSQWSDLGKPAFFGKIALADPSMSGSVTKAFEMLIQQQIQLAIVAANEKAGANLNEEEMEAAIENGWARGLRLIQDISSNARYFTDSATKIPLDVAHGNAAAGMCIDFYGRSYNQRLMKKDGSSRVHFVSPIGGTSVGADPIGMFRGAPNGQYANWFIEFVLSPEGQRLWNYKVGAPGGPVKTALRRLPIRKDSFTAAERAHFVDSKAEPYEDAQHFVYKPEYTGKYFGALRMVIKAMCIDTHTEQKNAREALIENDFPKRASDTFHDIRLVSYAQLDSIREALRSKNKLALVRLSRDLSNQFRSQYLRAVMLAEQKR